MRAHELLQQAQDALRDRAKTRDQESERSMSLTVKIFHAMTSVQLSELDGWRFMVALKLARAARGQNHTDDWVDLAGYAALAGECSRAEVIPPPHTVVVDGEIIPHSLAAEILRDKPDDDESAMDAEPARYPNPVCQVCGD